MAADRPASTRRYPLQELATAAAFFACACVAIVLTRLDGGVSLVWPGNAVAAALLIRLRDVHWLQAFVSIGAAGIAANGVVAGDTLPFACALTAINLVEIAAMVGLYGVVFRLPYPNLTIAQATQMTLVMGVAVTGIASIGGGLLVHDVFGGSLSHAILQWWSSDALGACLFAPPLILYSREGLARLLQREFAWRNALTVVACTAAAGLAMRHLEFPFVVFGLPLMMAAFAVGGFGATILGACTGVVVIGLWSAGIHPPGIEVHGDALEHFPVLALLAAVMPPMAVGLGTDARRATTRALRHSERRVRESLEHSRIGTMLMGLDGICTFSNAALHRMLGYSHEELRAIPHEVLTHPEDVVAMRQRWQRLLGHAVDSYEIERRILHKDGSWIWVRGAISLVRDDDGRPQHYIAQIESLQARRRAEQNLAEERERLRVTLGAIGDAVITTDTDSRITYMNDAACRLLGQTLEQVADRRLGDVTSLTDPDSLRRIPDLVGQCVLRGEVLRRDAPFVLHRPDSGASYVTAVVSPIQDPQGRVSSIVVVLHDATEGFERTRDLRHRATHDSLTELANRVEFNRRLAEVFERSRLRGSPAAVIAFDLDRFKDVNDTGGHAAGDAVLRRVAMSMKALIAPSDTVARLGGDEFAIILRECPPQRCESVARQLQEALNPLETIWQGERYRTGASLGLAMLTSQMRSETAWLAAADEASYQSKRRGRGELTIARADAAPLAFRSSSARPATG